MRNRHAPAKPRRARFFPAPEGTQDRRGIDGIRVLQHGDCDFEQFVLVLCVDVQIDQLRASVDVRAVDGRPRPTLWLPTLRLPISRFVAIPVTSAVTIVQTPAVDAMR
jgi:hypothetical protein